MRMDPEAVANRSAAQKARMRDEDPAVRAARIVAAKAGQAAPEARAKMSEARKAWWAARKGGEVSGLPGLGQQALPVEAAPPPVASGAGEGVGLAVRNWSPGWRGKGAPWQPEEDARAVELAVAVRQKGGSTQAAVEVICAATGRPHQGVIFRLAKVLRGRVEAGLRAVGAPLRPVAVKASRPARKVWTVEDDARALALIRSVLRCGGGVTAAIAAAAVGLGRSCKGVQARWNVVLKFEGWAPVDAPVRDTLRRPLRRPLRQADAPVRRVVLPPDVAARVARVPLRLGLVSTQLDGVADDPLAAHLGGLPHGRGWSVARDLALMQALCDGWPVVRMAAALGVSEPDIRARLDALQGRDPVSGQRRFARDLVRAALRGLLAAGGAA